MRVKEYRVVAAMIDSEMIRIIPMILESPALNIYRIKGNNWVTWADFERDMRAHYQDEHYSEKLADEARARTQGANEPTYDYITSMQLIFSKMPEKPTEAKQIERIYRNMRPEYHPLMRP